VTPAARREIGLDWLNFFVANVQTGFGPFIAVYLTEQEWTQVDIGVALSVGTFAAMASQVPAGVLVDAMPNKRFAALSAVVAITVSALLFAVWPERLSVFIAEVAHGFASCMLTPALAAISLVLVGRARLGNRLGRNARYASIGNGLAAAVMGACGTYVSSRAVFLLTAALTIPGLLALRAIGPARAADAPDAIDRAVAQKRGASDLGRLFTDWRLLVFAGVCLLFHMSNAGMLPLAGSIVTEQVGQGANLVIAACIVVPQAVVALLSPWVGRSADHWGRRPLLMLGFAALPVRGVLLAVTANPWLLIVVQSLDGVSAAAFGVLLPLVAADLTRGTNRFNLCLGLLGVAIGAGATISTTLAGTVSEQFGNPAAFLALAGSGMLSVLLVLVAMPETRPRLEPPPGA